MAQFTQPLRTFRNPEMSLGADDPSPAFLQELMEFRRLERPAGAIHEAAHAILFALRRVTGEAIQFLEPERMLPCPLEIETTGVEDALEGNPREIGLDDIGDRVQR